jgi:hypothetical protein
MHINGKIENIEIKDNSVKYNVIKEDKSYNVLSLNRQAVKDAIFLRQGQNINIDGNSDGDVIYVSKAMIDINRQEKE